MVPCEEEGREGRGVENGGKINGYKGTRSLQLGTTLRGDWKGEDKGIFRMVSLAQRTVLDGKFYTI